MNVTFPSMHRKEQKEITNFVFPTVAGQFESLLVAMPVL